MKLHYSTKNFSINVITGSSARENPPRNCLVPGRPTYQLSYARHTAKTHFRKFEAIIPRKGIARPQSIFPYIHVSVSDFLLQEICGTILVRRGSVMVRRGSVGSASACCKAGPSSVLGSAPQGGSPTEQDKRWRNGERLQWMATDKCIIWMWLYECLYVCYRIWKKINNPGNL